MKVEVAVLGSPFLISPYGLCGRKATLNLNLNRTCNNLTEPSPRQDDVALVDSVSFVFTACQVSVSVVSSRETMNKTGICCRIYPSLVEFLHFLPFVFLFDVLSVAALVIRQTCKKIKKNKS